MERLSAEQVRHVASLARLGLTDAEVDRLRTDLGSVLGYVERLRSAPTAGVEPLVHVGSGGNRLDEDEPGPTLGNAGLMKMAPRAEAPFVAVPKVLDEGLSS